MSSISLVQNSSGTASMVDGTTSRVICNFDPSSGFDDGTIQFVTFKDDFLGDVISDQWNATQGSDGQGAIAAIVAGAHGGIVRLTSGDAGTGTAADGSVLAHALNWIPANGGLFMEALIRCNTSVANICLNVGFTDTIALEMPISLSGTTLTTNATDAAVFVFDTAATTDVFNVQGVKNNTDTALTAATGALAPVADTLVRLGVAIDTSGTATFYHNGVMVGQVANAVTASVALTPVIAYETRTTTVKVVDVDYVRVGALRAA